MRIEVNHRYLKDLAAAASTYCTTQKREMSSADQEIKAMLGSGWTGPDAQAFGAQWEKVDGSDSTAAKFYNAMKAYGEALEACAQLYRDAQAEAYNKARFLRSDVFRL